MTRPLKSQIAAWVSKQSEIIDEGQLEKEWEHYQVQFGDGKVPRPPYWGGFILVPNMIEFWQGRPNRLHDRLRYRLIDSGEWIFEKLSP